MSGDRFGDSGGFTWVELIATMAVAGILLASATPSVVALIERHRITTQVNLLLTDLHFARSEAIMRGRDVVVCRSIDGQQCAHSPGAVSDWSMGRIVFANLDSDQQRDPGEPLLQARAALPEGLRLRFNQWWRVSYHAHGGARNGTFSLCGPTGAEQARALTLYYTGRPRVNDTRADGSAIHCD